MGLEKSRVFGVEIEPLPEGAVVTEVLIAFKGMDENGESSVYTRTSTGLAVWERIGILTMLLDEARSYASATFEDDS
jgi:hypothetical protein